MLKSLRLGLYRKSIAYLALLAMMFGVFLPSLSQAIVPLLQNDSVQVAVCTTSGIKYISVSTDNNATADENEPTSLKANHCENCGTTTYAYLAPTLKAFLQPAAPQKSFNDVLTQTWPCSSSSWCPANPRAPPLHT